MSCASITACVSSFHLEMEIDDRTYKGLALSTARDT